MAPSKAAGKAPAKTTRRRPAPVPVAPVTPSGEPSVQLSAGGLVVQATGFGWDELDAVLGRLARALDGALAAHPVLRDRVSHVPGGSIGYVEDDDGGSRRRVGFTAGG